MVWIAIVILTICLLLLGIVLYITIDFINKNLVNRKEYEDYRKSVRSCLEALSASDVENNKQVNDLLNATADDIANIRHEIQALDNKVEYTKIDAENKLIAMRRNYGLSRSENLGQGEENK